MYVVTGGAGFIGSNVLAALEELGLAPLVVVDRLRDGLKWRNIAKRELFDIVAPENLGKFLEIHNSDIKAIIHMGAISATTETDADLIVRSNFQLSMMLWNWCTANETPLIYASSAATYGDGQAGSDDVSGCADLKTFQPLNAYGWSKHLFDRRIARMLDEDEPRPPQWAGLKFFNVFGPNEYHKGRMQSVISQLYPRAVQGDPAVLFRSHNPKFQDGGQLRDFVWVGDCVDMILWLVAHPDISGLFNCGTGKARSFADLTLAVYQAVGREAVIEFVDTPIDIRDKYQYFTEACMDKIRSVGFNVPATSLEMGVKNYVADYLSKDDPYR